MSAEAFDAGLALRARMLGRAAHAASTLHVVLHDEAIGIVPVAMAGERTGLWGIGISKIRRRIPRTAAVGDARDFDEQTRLWAEMAPTLASAGDEPQLVVPHRHSARLLAESAVRFCHHPDSQVAAAARTVWWCCGRGEIAGSHSLVVLTDVLSEHFAIGEDGGPGDDLRVWLAWLESQGHDDLARRLVARDAEPSDPKTSLEFDERLWPKVARRSEERAARRAAVEEGVSDIERERSRRDIERQAHVRAATVKAALQPTITAGWRRLMSIVDLLASDPRSPIADLGRFCDADQESWARERQRRARCLPVARRDSARTAILGLAEADAALACWQGTLVWGDTVAQARALASGAAISGTVAGVDDAGFAVVVSTARPVRARAGDTMAVVGPDGPVEVEVADVEAAGERLAVSVVWAGRPIPLPEGDATVLWPSPADFGRRWIGWLAQRISATHWALGDTPDGEDISPLPAHTSGERLAAVNALQKVRR